MLDLVVGLCLPVGRTRLRQIGARQRREYLSLLHVVRRPHLDREQPPAHGGVDADHAGGIGLDAGGDVEIVGELGAARGGGRDPAGAFGQHKGVCGPRRRRRRGSGLGRRRLPAARTPASRGRDPYDGAHQGDPLEPHGTTSFPTARSSA